MMKRGEEFVKAAGRSVFVVMRGEGAGSALRLGILSNSLDMLLVFEFGDHLQWVSTFRLCLDWPCR